MCLQPIMAIKAICAPRHLAHKQRTADADWSLLCCPPFSFVSVIDTWAKPTKINPKNLPTTKPEFLLASYFTHIAQAELLRQHKSLRQVRCVMSLLLHQIMASRVRMEQLWALVPVLGLFLAEVLTKHGQSGHLVSKDSLSITCSFVIDAAEVIWCHPFNTDTEMTKQVIIFLHGRSHKRHKDVSPVSKNYSQGFINITLNYMLTTYAVFEIDTSHGSYVEEILLALLLCFKAVYTAQWQIPAYIKIATSLKTLEKKLSHINYL